MAADFRSNSTSDFTPNFDTANDIGLSNVLPMGTRMAEFELIDVIGEGGFGIVYKARDHSLDRIIAIKEYMPAAIAGRGTSRQVMVKSDRHAETFEAGARSFVNEAKLLARFDHPALLKVYRFWETNGTAYLAMPYYEGATLKQALKDLNAPPSEAWIRALLEPLLDALHLIHDQQCFHRDIAPDNILILPGHKPLLLDFGAARRVIGDMTQMLTVFLKPGFAPIEQYADMPGIRQGPWTDLYALGAVLYNALTGSVPPPSVGRMMNDRMLPAQERLAGQYSPALLEGIDRCLAVMPEARLQSAAQFSELLEVPWQVPIIAPITQPTIFPVTAAQQPVITQKLDPDPLPLPHLVALSDPASLPDPVLSPDPLPLPELPLKRQGGKDKRLLIAGIAAVIALAAGLGYWSTRTSTNTTDPTITATPSPPVSKTPDASLPAPSVPATPSAEPAPVNKQATTSTITPLSLPQILDTIKAGAMPDWRVVADPVTPQLVIAKDRLQFSVQSTRAGYLYVWMLGTDGKAITQIFPNAADTANKLSAGKLVLFPRQGWALEAAGPAGKNRILALVSENPANFQSLGLPRGKPSATTSTDFDIEKINSLVAAKGAQAIIDSWNCVQTASGKGTCKNYGAAMFEVQEIVR